jgi:hypothetical protein
MYSVVCISQSGRTNIGFEGFLFISELQYTAWLSMWELLHLQNIHKLLYIFFTF